MVEDQNLRSIIDQRRRSGRQKDQHQSSQADNFSCFSPNKFENSCDEDVVAEDTVAEDTVVEDAVAEAAVTEDAVAN